jgi:hypothetical protein
MQGGVYTLEQGAIGLRVIAGDVNIGIHSSALCKVLSCVLDSPAVDVRCSQNEWDTRFSSENAGEGSSYSALLKVDKGWEKGLRDHAGDIHRRRTRPVLQHVAMCSAVNRIKEFCVRRPKLRACGKPDEQPHLAYDNFQEAGLPNGIRFARLVKLRHGRM